MFANIKKFHQIIISSFICIFLGIVTFLTFIDEGFIPLTDNNLQILLIIDVILLIIFFTQVFLSVLKIYSDNKKQVTGSKTNLKYISLFSIFTFLPSFLIAIFSLFLFNFGVQNFFNKQITLAVNNSYDVAKNYLEESKKTIESDIFLMSVGINRAANLFYSNPNRFKNIVRSEKLLRRVDEVFLIDSVGNIILADAQEEENFNTPSEENFNLALEGLPVIISNNRDKASVIMKLNNLIDTYLYISRNIDPKILNYLNETEEAVNFYYSVENSQTGIKITFAVIYIIIVTLLLFLSVVFAVTFAKGLTKPIINLIAASENISKGELNTKVPDLDDVDSEIMLLNKNFNNMIDRLKKQQDKLLTAERYSAWESIARKLAHEIKNPLTPIQLSIDRLREKYSKKILDDGGDFNNYLETINRQIKDIENLTNEFSSFARMPKPLMREVNIVQIIKRAVDFNKMYSENSIIFKPSSKEEIIRGDDEQLYRAFINLIKNSEEAINEEKLKTPDFKGKIEVVIFTNNGYIFIKLTDNGNGISDTKKIMTPYFTTKKNGTGLGLPIVNKIINEHSGELTITNNHKKGVEVQIILPKYK